MFYTEQRGAAQQKILDLRSECMELGLYLITNDLLEIIESFSENNMALEPSYCVRSAKFVLLLAARTVSSIFFPATNFTAGHKL